MSGERISHEEMMALFEAARWAPSSYNDQPWRYIYAERETPEFAKLLSLLVPANQRWADKAGLLGVALAKKTFERNGKPSPSHAFTAGASWQNLSLEGSHRRLVVHGMEGFDYSKTRELLEIPEDYEILAMFAVGKRAPLETLPQDLQQKDIPSGRKKVEEFLMEGKFRK